MKTPELRIKRTNIWTPGRPKGIFGWEKGFDQTLDVIQYKSEEGWTELPIEYENFRVYKDKIDRDRY